MTEVERILDQLKRAYEGSAWYGSSVREVLNFVTAEQAHARPFAEAHSIWELTHHIAVWENAARRRLSGDRAQIEISSPEDWPPADDPSEAAWEKTKEAVKQTHDDLVKAVAVFPDSRLNEQVPGKTESYYNFYYMFSGIVQHELYHAGQIALLKKFH